jgi:hypothetical protein
MLNVGIHRKPIGIIFEHYLEALDRGDTHSFERDLYQWMENSNNRILQLELRRIWYRIIDGDLVGAKEMVLELQEQYIDCCGANSTTLRFLDRRLKEKGY